MNTKSYRTTTAIVASLSLMLPSVTLVSPALAQDELLMCLDRSPPPCPEGQPIDGMTLAEIEAIEAANAAAAQAAAEQAAAEQAAAEEAAAEQAAAEQAAAQAAAEQAAAEQAAAEQAAAQAAAEQAAAEQAAAEQAAAEQAAAEQAAAEQAAAEQAAAEQAAAEQAAAAQAAADQAAAEQAAADQAAADQAAAEQAAADQAAADQAAAEQAAAEQAAAEQAAADQAAAEQAAAEQAAAEQAAAEQAAAEQAAAEQAAAEQAAAEQAAAEQAAAEQAAEGVVGPDGEAVILDPTIPEAPLPPIEATLDDGSGPAPVITEQVLTDEAVRSSDQDFSTPVDGNVAAQVGTDNNDSGLTDLQKILLLGLGAVVVGSILNNGDEVVSNSGDRVVVRTDDGYTVYKDDDALLRQPGTEMRTETFADGSTRTFLTRPDGTQVVTIRDAQGRVLRRARVFPDGTEVQLFDDLAPAVPVDIRTLETENPRPRNYSEVDLDRDALRLALRDAGATDLGRSFSLRQIREIVEVRDLVPGIDLDGITFATGSAAILPEQTRSLVRLGILIEEFITDNPGEVFLIEGHTDATGGESYNLALSDRRAETVALALTETFGIPPENLVVQGYGEEFLKVDTQLSEQANRRATVRRITPLLRQVAAQ